MREIQSLGRRFFWIKATGMIVAERSLMSEGIESTKEEDFEVYAELKGYDSEAIEMTTFEYGHLEDEFKEAKGWRFNPETSEIVFNYNDKEEPVYKEPLSNQVQALETQVAELKAEVAALKSAK